MDTFLKSIRTNLFTQKCPRLMILFPNCTDRDHDRLTTQPIMAGNNYIVQFHQICPKLYYTDCRGTPQVIGRALEITLGHTNFVMSIIDPVNFFE